MRLTKTTGHAIRILIDCAEADGERVKVASVAERLGISQLNAFKIVHILSKAGFLEAMRGRNGGVRLAQSAQDIRIGTIVREIEATAVTVADADAAMEPGAKGPKRAPINTILDDALAAFIGVLDQHTLADLSSRRKRVTPTRGRPVPMTDRAKAIPMSAPRKAGMKPMPSAVGKAAGGSAKSAAARRGVGR